MVHLEFLEQPLEEVLEIIWRQTETGGCTREAVLARSRETDTAAILDRLRDRGLLLVEGETLRLSPNGEERARSLVRRHRLAERLLADVLDVPLAESNQQACLLEHILSPAVTDAVCSFLGHPPTCPHGLAIPAGACCQDRRRGGVKPVVTSLRELEPGRSGRIVFIAPGVARRLDRLGSFGVVPGTTLVLKQKHPSTVIEVGGTTLALEGEVADGIFVRHEA
jgi:DtxR family Mn-dependent transcriptional regulator